MPLDPAGHPAPSLLGAPFPGREEELCASWQRRCDALLAIMPGLVLRLRRDGTYLEYHPAPGFPSVRSPDGVLGHTVREMLPPAVARRRMAAIERALTSGQVQELKYVLETDGGPRRRHERIAPSGPEEVVVLVRDVSDGREVEERLPGMRHQLGLLFGGVPDTIAVLSRGGTLLFVNRSEGVSPAALVGTSIFRHLKAAEQTRLRAAMGRKVSANGAATFYATGLGPLGKATWYACRLAPVVMGGRVSAFTLVASDCAAWEHLLEALRESEERYRGLVEGSRDAIFITMRDGRVLDFNQAALDLFGYTRDELPGINVTKLYVDPADRDRFRAEIERHGSVWDYEVKLRRRDGTELIGLLTATVRTAKDGTTEGYQGIVRDVTQRRRLEREVLATSEREQRRIGQDLHDGLGQHLTGVAFLSKVLTEKLGARGLPEAAEAAKIEALVREAISETRRLAKGLQPVALDNGGLAVALTEMCRHVTRLFGIPCSCRLLEDLHVADGAVGTHVYHIAREAIHNAVKHSEARGIFVELRGAGGTGELIVRDDGIGFQFRRKSHRGLGLNIMRYRAAMIGGSLDVKTAPASGTTVVCAFPLSGSRA